MKAFFVCFLTNLFNLIYEAFNRYADDTVLLANPERKLKELLNKQGRQE